MVCHPCNHAPCHAEARGIDTLLSKPPAAVAAGGFLFLPSPPFVSCFVSVCVIEVDKTTRGDSRWKRKQDWETALARSLVAVLEATADWKKIARNQFAGDIFEHRVQVASTSPNFRAVSEKLCNTLSFQYPPVSPELVDFL